jgi:hypothetical protein
MPTDDELLALGFGLALGLSSFICLCILAPRAALAVLAVNLILLAAQALSGRRD